MHRYVFEKLRRLRLCPPACRAIMATPQRKEVIAIAFTEEVLATALLKAGFRPSVPARTHQFAP